MASKEVITDLKINNGPNNLVRCNNQGKLESTMIPNGIYIFKGVLPTENKIAVMSPSFDLEAITGISNINLWNMKISFYVYGDPGFIAGVPDTSTGERWYLAYPSESEKAKISFFSTPDGNINTNNFFFFLGANADQYHGLPYRLVMEWNDYNPEPVSPI